MAMRTNNAYFIQRLDIDFNAGDGIPSWHFNDDSAMLNPANWTAAEMYQNRGKSQGDAVTAQLDGDYEVSDSGFLRKFSFGVRHDARNSTQASPRPVAPSVMGFPLFSTIDENFYYVNEGFMDGEADVPTTWLAANGWYINGHRDELRQIYGVAQGDPVLIEAFNVGEATSTVYAQADMKLGDKLAAQL